MRPNRDTPISQALARLASRRHGIVTLEQLRALGYSDSAIARLVRAGRLHRLYPGVFAVGHMALTTRGRLLAAVLACGTEAALSHASAGGLSGLRPDAGARIHVTVPTTNGRRPPRAIALHRTRRPIESTIVDGIPVTTPMRTLADLADTLPQRQLEKALGYEADFTWPAQRLIVEADSWRHHSSRERFEHDRRRDAQHTAAGWRVVRLTHARIHGEPDETARLLRRLTTPRPLPPRGPAAG